MRANVPLEAMVLFIGFLLASLVITGVAVKSIGSYSSEAESTSTLVQERVSNSAELISAFYVGPKTYVLVQGVSGAIPVDKVTVLLDGVPQTANLKEYKGDGDELIEKGELFYVILPFRAERGSLSFQSTTVSAVVGFISNPPEFSFPYRVKVRIQNSSGLSPADYPVRVELNSTNFNLSHLATSDCSDLLPVDLNMRPLPFYVEECSADRVVLWVKLPQLLPDQNIYLLYGKAGLPPESNGHEVFTFFDDAEKFSGWTQYGNGKLSQYCGLSYDGSCSIWKSTANDPNGGFKSMGTLLERNFAVEVWIYRTTTVGGDCDRIGVIDGSGNGYGFVYCHLSTIGVGVDVRSNYGGSIVVSSDLGTDVLYDWYFARLIVYGNEINAEYYYNGVFQDRVSLVDNTYNSFSNFYIFGGYDYVVDHIIVRKIVLPEPSVTVYAEESGSFVPQ
ncbi:MAG: DUF2341 domain-containing protein [Candidatus Diapherotrites archaeon]|nr:DUF2341 domain-containing protein [Candidatus Diapherotrites archaeon]